MSCSHDSIRVMEGYLLCVKCSEEFRNGELAVIRNKREMNCSHSNLEHGYASNPPKSKCIDCGKFFFTDDL